MELCAYFLFQYGIFDYIFIVIKIFNPQNSKNHNSSFIQDDIFVICEIL